MSYKDNLSKRIIVIVYHLTIEQVLEARVNRNWKYYDELEEVEKLQYRLEELSIYEDILEGITEDDMSRIMKEMYDTRFG